MLIVIAAVARNGVIGNGSQIPWKIPADFARFKRLTMGHTLLMGRKTYASIGRPLPGRRTVIVSRAGFAAPEGVAVAPSVEAALALCRDQGAGTVFSAGGAEIYRACLPLADRLQLTHVEQDFDGDVRFPEVDWSRWRVTHEERVAATDAVPYAYRFVDYERS
jgi:dihydrofolate reductase